MVFLIKIVVHAQEEVERRRIAGQLAEQGMYLPAMVCLVVEVCLLYTSDAADE